ncbi:hypothetical protein J6R97_00195 [bacterium]|nr:hypothetical protein [bacterium]
MSIFWAFAVKFEPIISQIVLLSEALELENILLAFLQNFNIKSDCL